MKKVAFIILSVFLSISLFACSSEKSNDNSGTEKDWTQIKIPDNEILLISRYINFADTYTNRGIFIDSDGKIYEFDFSEDGKNQNSTDKDFLNKLQEVRSSEAMPLVTLETDMLKELYSYLSEINTCAPFEKEQEAWDAGEHQLMINNISTHTLVLCRETGDYTGVIKDTNAQRMLSFYDENVVEVIRSASEKENAAA